MAPRIVFIGGAGGVAAPDGGGAARCGANPTVVMCRRFTSHEET